MQRHSCAVGTSQANVTCNDALDGCVADIKPRRALDAFAAPHPVGSIAADHAARGVARQRSIQAAGSICNVEIDLLCLTTGVQTIGEAETMPRFEQHFLYKPLQTAERPIVVDTNGHFQRLVDASLQLSSGGIGF